MSKNLPEPTGDGLLTTEDVRRYLALPSKAAVYAMVRRGELPALRVGRRRIRFRTSDVLAVVRPLPEQEGGR